MCGIYGFVGSPNKVLLDKMGAVLFHRGPNDVGHIEFPNISMGHRRLSIIDIAGGHQPMPNEDESIWLVFNGEIYNYRELRADLIRQGHTFRTNSDSEVIIHSYEEYGPECFSRFNGMWAVALADLRTNRLVLCRDHFGIKPLHYAKTKDRILFASEIKALLQDPDIEASPNEQMVYEYLTLGLHDHSRETFFKGIYRVMPATYVEIDLPKVSAKDTSVSESLNGTTITSANGASGKSSGGLPVSIHIGNYWTPTLSESGSADPKEFHRLFRKAVERRLVSEVPVGSCLSGGLDSTSIVCLMRDLLRDEAPDAASMGGRLRTFSAIFDNDPIDEREYITLAIDASTAHPTYIRPQAKTFAQELADLVWHQEEPFVSTGPYAQWCVMREAKNTVTVLLDGQGGDELLAGYVPYHFVYLRQLLRQGKVWPMLKEAWAARDIMVPFLTRRFKQRKKHFPIRSSLKPEFVARCKEASYGRSSDNLKERLLKDLTTYSLPCLLRYEDRNSMAFSIESRIPYLDQELVEWILRLPSDAIIHNGWSRAVLREGLRGVIPDKIRERRWKVGFTTPEMRWLKALRATFTSLFKSPSFQSRPYWNPEVVANAFRDACEGKLEDSMFFWRAANVEIWLREFIDARKDFFSDENPSGGNAKTREAKAAQKDRQSGTEGETPGASSTIFTGGLNRTVADLGDRIAVMLADRAKAAPLLESFKPNQGKHLFACAGRSIYARLPIRTGIVKTGDDIVDIAKASLSGLLEPGDIVAIAEKPISISQGRSFPIDQIRTSWLAKVLSRAVTRTPHGIGLGIPQTMQLALNEVGASKIIFAAAVAAVARLVGVRGIFYKIAGKEVEAIDGPTPGTLPPYNREASLGPKDPAGVAKRIAQSLGTDVGVAVVDTNDLSAAVLGHSDGVDPDLVASLLLDNPMGQGHEQTPIIILRQVGRLP